MVRRHDVTKRRLRLITASDRCAFANFVAIVCLCFCGRLLLLWADRQQRQRI